MNELFRVPFAPFDDEHSTHTCIDYYAYPLLLYCMVLSIVIFLVVYGFMPPLATSTVVPGTIIQVLSRTSPGTVSFVVSWIGSLAYLNNYKT